jgi:hypothetical protein
VSLFEIRYFSGIREMSKNSAATRAGLARLRPLSAKPDVTTRKSDAATLPEGWYFNETREADFWQEMEGGSDHARDSVHEDLLKKNEHQSELQDSSHKISALVDQFDNIDQDAFMALMEFYDESVGAETPDSHQIMNDEKASVVDFMEQLKDLSDSQTSLMERLRFWFTTIQQQSQNTDGDIRLDPLPRVENVFSELTELLRKYTEKSERAAFLHNDINDYWFKQVATFKRAFI